jgi:tRNA(Leu) C34 or U34 (ribose-2'-O)-methylase TrmL
MRKLKTSELNRINVDEFQKAEKSPVVIVLDNVRSMNNVGSIFRTSDAFLVEKIYLCGITGTPPHREITKTAIGAEKSVNWEYHQSTMDVVNQLKSEGYTVYSIEQASDSADLMHMDYPQGKLAFVFGNEIDGVQQEVIDASHHCLEIPQLGTKHSFNVAVSCGIVLWDFTKFRNINLSKLSIVLLAFIFSLFSCTSNPNSHPPKQNDKNTEKSDTVGNNGLNNSESLEVAGNGNQDGNDTKLESEKNDESNLRSVSKLNPDEYLRKAEYSVLISYSIDCPMCNRYTADLVAIQKEIVNINKVHTILKKGRGLPKFQFGLIKVNSDEVWDMDGFNPPIQEITISDGQHEFVKRLNMNVYPEAVVLNSRGEILYKGKIDDRAVSTGVTRPQAKVRYLSDAINQLNLGKKVATPSTRAQGCYIETK